MNALKQALERAAYDLNELRAGWALIGGLAVSARAEPRFTRDVDVSVAVSGDAEAEQLVFSLRARGYTILATVEQDAVRRLATARLGSPESSPVIVDLLFASSGIERETVAAAQPIEILDGLILPVAALPSLLALKVLSVSNRRPRDFEDIQALMKEATATELADVPRLLGLITERGYARDKNLAQEWAQFLSAC